MGSARNDADWRTILDRLTALLGEQGAAGWIVGGSLRDALLGLPIHDLDIAISADPLALAQRLAPRGTDGLARLRRGTIRVVLAPTFTAHLDLTLLQGDNIEADLALRDFRVNALAQPLAGREHFLAALLHRAALPAVQPPQLIDPFGGLEDLRARRLDAVSSQVFRDDPGRILRGARLAAHLGLMVTPRTVALAQDASPLLAELPADRVRDELNLLFGLERVADGFAVLRAIGALPVLFAKTVPDSREQAEDIWEHLIASLSAQRWFHEGTDSGRGVGDSLLPVERLQTWYAAPASGEHLLRRVALGWATALHALTTHSGSGAVDTIQHSLLPSIPFVRGLPPRVMQTVAAWHDAETLICNNRLDEVAVRQFFDRFGPGGETAVDALLVALACIRARGRHGDAHHKVQTAINNVGRVLTAYFDDPDFLLPPRLIDGGQIIRALGMAQGPLVGHIIRQVRAEQLAGHISTPEEALAYARRLAATSR